MKASSLCGVSEDDNVRWMVVVEAMNLRRLVENMTIMAGGGYIAMSYQPCCNLPFLVQSEVVIVGDVKVILLISMPLVLTVSNIVSHK